MLGVCYEKGECVEQSYEKAVELYKVAAEKGDYEAEYNLGNCYRYGRGVERSYDKAVKCYKNSGITKAKLALNEIYSLNNPFANILKRIQFKFGYLK